MRSGEEIFQNLEKTLQAVERAEQENCDLVCFPENIFYRGPRSAMPLEVQLEFDSGGHLKGSSEFSKKLQAAAAKWKVSVSLGSVPERRGPNSAKIYNTHAVFLKDRNKRGQAALYRKIHLFGFRSGDSDLVYNEGSTVERGLSPVAVQVKDFLIGLSICFDLRFPELYRHLTLNLGTTAQLVPSAFTRETGEAHWHALLKARAIENLSYVAAVAQWGEHRAESGKSAYCYGHSLCFSPWGELIYEAPAEGDSFGVIEWDFTEVQRRRSQLSALDSRVFECVPPKASL